ncbi:SGNH/GDSL hydrolase family protein [Candidatus Omnitrophota bacterium]
MYKTKIIKNIIFTIIAVISVLGSLEGLARLKYPLSKFPFNAIFTYDRNKGYTLKKNLSTTFSGKKVTTNSFGHRDKEIPIEKQKGEYRILALGDSVTFGYGVLAKETYPEILENTIKIKKKININVINTACPGNSTLQEYYDLKNTLIFKPNKVILQFLLNDVIEQYHFANGYEDRKIGNYPVFKIWHMQHFLRWNSTFYAILQIKIKTLKEWLVSAGLLKKKVIDRNIYTSRYALAKQDDPRIAKAWTTCLLWMHEIHALCTQYDVPLTIILIPMRFQVSESFAASESTPIETFCRNNNINYIDYAYIFREELKDEYYADYFLDSMHLSKKGHQFVANHLYEELRDDL